MPPSNKLTLALALTAAVASLTACGGGGSAAPETAVTPPVVVPTAAKGVMIDGYVSGATVFCDSNGNGVLDSGELSTTTSSSGAYEIAGGCNATVIGYGGTNVDTGFAFGGVLKAPAGSTVITPLTTLLVGTGLSTARLAELLGQPAGTDVTKIDVANGQNADLFKKTLAVHQLLDSIARVTVDKTGSTDLQAVYTRVTSDFAKALATQSSGTQFISGAGDVNTTVLTSIVTNLPDIVALRIIPADIAVAVTTLTAQAQQFSKATTTDPVALAAVAKALQDPERPPVDLAATTSYVTLAGDALAVNGETVKLSAFAGGVSVAGLQTIGINLGVTGTPASENVARVALELIERDGEGRRLQLMIDEVFFKIDAQGQVRVVVPSTAKVYAYGYTANGTEINLTLSDLGFSPIRVVNNGFTLNYTNIVNKVAATADVAARTTAERFLNIKGTFDTRVVISGLNIRKADSTAYANQSLTILNTTKSVTGPSFSGALTIQ
jgi:hypothetical protein